MHVLLQSESPDLNSVFKECPMGKKKRQRMPYDKVIFEKNHSLIEECHANGEGPLGGQTRRKLLGQEHLQ